MYLISFVFSLAMFRLTSKGKLIKTICRWICLNALFRVLVNVLIYRYLTNETVQPDT